MWAARFALLSLALCAGCAGYRIRAARSEVAIVRDLPYVAGSSHRKHRLDLYLPRGRRGFPVVLFVHGGFWRNQDRRYLQDLIGLYGNVGVALARRGVGVAVPSYRLLPEAGIREQLDDVLAALRWVQGNIAGRGGDPRALVLMGYSAGGHLVTLLGLDARHYQAAGIDASGIRGYAALSGLLDLPLMAAQQEPAFNREVTFRLFGRSAEEQARWSPSAHLRPDAPPLLLLVAAGDYSYVRQGNRGVAARLTALGARAELREIPDLTHAGMILSIHRSDDRVSDVLAAFVRSVTAN